MCLAVYLASSNVLPPIAWDKEAPAFESVTPGDLESSSFQLQELQFLRVVDDGA